MSYQVKVRQGPKVKREKRDSLAEALDVVERHARTAPRREAVDFVSRRFQPGDLIALRVELKGDGVRAGLDVRGDGTLVAWTGRFVRKQLPGDPLHALRHSVKVDP